MFKRAEERFDGPGRTIATANPDHLWRMAKKETHLMEVGVLGHYGKSMLSCVSPDLCVNSALQTDITNMDRLREKVRDGTDEAWR